jgi:hypothetical protein
MVANSLLRFTGQIESNYDEITDSFDAMNLKPELLRGESGLLKTQMATNGNKN